MRDSLNAAENLLTEVQELRQKVRDLEMQGRVGKQIEERFAELLGESNKSVERVIGGLSFLTELQDPVTAWHHRRVTKLATYLAKHLEYPDENIQVIRLAAEVHDIGNLLLLDRQKTTDHSRDKLKLETPREHVELGYALLSQMDFPLPVAEVVRQHHERLDGSGYPAGIRCEDILPEAKILSLADEIEHVSGQWRDRRAVNVEAVMGQILAGKGTLYDRKAVEACAMILSNYEFNPPF